VTDDAQVWIAMLALYWLLLMQELEIRRLKKSIQGGGEG
jgi:hypothetical protein